MRQRQPGLLLPPAVIIPFKHSRSEPGVDWRVLRVHIKLLKQGALALSFRTTPVFVSVASHPGFFPDPVAVG